jgi:hypothetical protein
MEKKISYFGFGLRANRGVPQVLDRKKYFLLNECRRGSQIR